MSRITAMPGPTSHPVVVKLTEEEYKHLVAYSKMNRRQPGPQAADIISSFLKMMVLTNGR
jgi:hypothetical protein